MSEFVMKIKNFKPWVRDLGVLFQKILDLLLTVPVMNLVMLELINLFLFVTNT